MGGQGGGYGNMSTGQLIRSGADPNLGGSAGFAGGQVGMSPGTAYGIQGEGQSGYNTLPAFGNAGGMGANPMGRPVGGAQQGWGIPQNYGLSPFQMMQLQQYQNARSGGGLGSNLTPQGPLPNQLGGQPDPHQINDNRPQGGLPDPHQINDNRPQADPPVLNDNRPQTQVGGPIADRAIIPNHTMPVGGGQPMGGQQQRSNK